VGKVQADMKRILLSASLALSAVISTLAQGSANNNTPQVIEWNEYYDLSWQDFKGERPGDAAGDAGTVVQIKAKPFLVKDEVDYDVFALFVKDKSWAEAYTASLLAHEKLHFDIAELYARKIRKKIAEMRAEKVTKVEAFNLAIQELLQESNEVDMQYDVETLHGGMVEKQKEWAERIKAELNGLREFKKKKRVITAG
jgi:hypothetical protein